VADQTPETPEALAEFAVMTAFSPSVPNKLERVQDRIRTRDAALIAQHTAELTATAKRHLEERDHYRGCCLEMETTRNQWQDRIAELEAQLTASAQRIADLEHALDSETKGRIGLVEALTQEREASAQREASARAEAIRECADEAETMASGSLWTAEAKHALRGLADRLRKFLTSPPPPRVDTPMKDTEILAEHVERLRADELGKSRLRLRSVEARCYLHDTGLVVGFDPDGTSYGCMACKAQMQSPRVDAWIPVESRQWKHGDVMWGYDRFYDKTGEVYFDGNRKLDNGTVGRFIFADGDDDCDIVLVHELPDAPDYPPPSDDSANGGSDAG
jgi:hypothetical protein